MNLPLYRIGALSILGLAAIWQPAHAQNTTANAGAQSGSAAQAASGSQAGSAAVVNQTFTGPPQQVITYGGRTGQDITYGGGTNNTTRLEGTQTIRNVPAIFAPALGGTNPCTQGASAGGAVAGFGISIGGQWSDPDCERRNASALLHNQGQPVLAQEVLCGNSAIREARQRLAALGQGALCAQDILAQQEAARRNQPAVTSVAFREVVGGGAVITPAPVQAASVRPDWCDTASVAERRQYRSTCG